MKIYNLKGGPVFGGLTLTPEGRIVSVLEAIVGQLFLAFLVVRLVAIYTANALKKKSDS